jgi:hypothetical protein
LSSEDDIVAAFAGSTVLAEEETALVNKAELDAAVVAIVSVVAVVFGIPIDDITTCSKPLVESSLCWFARVCRQCVNEQVHGGRAMHQRVSISELQNLL